MAWAEAYPMVGGDVAHGYAKNSSFQREIVDAARELISEAISENFDLKILESDSSSTVKIADLGCAVGPNTFFAMQNIIESIELKFQQAKIQNPSALEFQVFFNDHLENDFNTLFKTLPPSRKYFAAGMPGSFHGRLFPKSSLHFAHISSAIHWLSKVPKEIVDGNFPAWNKGGKQCTGSVEEVDRAYSTQFKNDMETFLNARAQELVPGGLMVILTRVPPDDLHFSDTYAGAFLDVLGSCLNDLAKMGVLKEEKVDSFNLPTYSATSKEFEAIFKTNRKFSLEKMEKWPEPITKTSHSPEVLASVTRAAMDGLVRKHFGDEFVDKIFNHFSTKLEENFSKIQEKEHNNNFNTFILLKRIVN